MNKFLHQVAEFYSTDVTTAGVTLAWVPRIKMYYASVCRYMLPRGGGKIVVCKVMAPSARKALVALRKHWLKFRGESHA